MQAKDKTTDVGNVSQFELESLARLILPQMREYFESNNIKGEVEKNEESEVKDKEITTA